ncbi:MAG: RNA polymerase sigma factor, partial [Planctomycetes bacterium]|nr:RNA polymerase sigma factor [Planctomycetota bacterium]
MNPDSVTIEQLLAHEGWLRRVVVDLVDDDEVDDILQETWIAALAARRILHPRAWLKRVAHNLARGRRRGAVRRRARETAAAKPEALPSTAEIVERVHAHRELATAVTEVTEPYRTAVLLRYFEQLTPREIAERLGIPASTVRTRIERGLEQVRGRLERRDVRGLAALVLLPRMGERSTRSVGLLAGGNDILTGVLAVSFRHKLASALSLVLVFVTVSIWAFSAFAEGANPDTDAVAAVAEVTPASDAPDAPELGDPTRFEPPSVEPPALHGVVRDAFGAPIANVPIEFVRTGIPVYSSLLDGLEPAKNGDRFELGASDANGRFARALDPGSGQILATGEFVTVRFYLPPSAQWSAEAADVIVARRGQVRGRVVDEQGNRIAGAVVVP